MLATVDRHGGQRTRFGPYAIVECSPVAWMRGVYLGAVHVVAAAKSSQSGYQADCFHWRVVSFDCFFWSRYRIFWFVDNVGRPIWEISNYGDAGNSRSRDSGVDGGQCRSQICFQERRPD